MSRKSGQYVSKGKIPRRATNSYSRSSYNTSPLTRKKGYQRSNYSRARNRSRKNTGKILSIASKVLAVVVVVAALGAGIWYLSGKIHIGGTRSAMKKAEAMAAQYDYTGAIEILQSIENYETKTKVTNKIKEYTAADEELVTIDNSYVTHVFVHSLVTYPEWTFYIDNTTEADNYNTTMTTVSEFEKIIQSMYDRGYVLVSLHDMYEMTTDSDGNEICVEKEIRLPEDKQAYVLSLDDLSYYEYMEGDGFPTRLVIAEDGVVRCEMTMQDGSVSVGNYDTVPIMEDFIAEHPDASYHGARGMIALTGYDGVLGYRTDSEYNTDEYKSEHPDFDYEQECESAKEIAEALKEEGWEFASHSWGHKNYTDLELSKIKKDMGKWLDNVVPIVGETDVLIYAFGAEIEEYGDGNDKFDYLKSVGFNCFCGINAATSYWVEYGKDYFRQSRRNLDGYRMYQDLINPDLNRLSDLMDVEEVFDKERPTPVPDY